MSTSELALCFEMEYELLTDPQEANCFLNIFSRGRHPMKPFAYYAGCALQ